MIVIFTFRRILKTLHLLRFLSLHHVLFPYEQDYLYQRKNQFKLNIYIYSQDNKVNTQ